MTDEQYKMLSIREFTKAANVYETDKAGVYRICRKDYPDVLAELEKRGFFRLHCVARKPLAGVSGKDTSGNVSKKMR